MLYWLRKNIKKDAHYEKNSNSNKYNFRRWECLLEIFKYMSADLGQVRVLRLTRAIPSPSVSERA